MRATAPVPFAEVIQGIIDVDRLPPAGKRRPLQLAIEPSYKPSPQPAGVPITIGGR